MLRTYCNKPYVCVKCGGSHNRKDCNKRRDTPAKCALCGGNHAANYKGCEHYHNIIKRNNTNRTSLESSIPIPNSAYIHTTTPHNLSQQQQQQRSYADVASNRAQLAEEPITTLKAYLEDFKGLFAQLIHQNSLILSRLTTVLNKPH